MEEPVLDDLDYKILNLISNDTRMSFLEVSRICDVSGGAVHQRIQKMINNEIITGSEFKLNLPKIGYTTCAYLKLQFNESVEIETVIKELNMIPEIVECHLTIGDFDLFIKVYAHTNAHLLDIVRQQIKPLGLTRMDSMISYGESFRKQIVFNKSLNKPIL